MNRLDRNPGYYVHSELLKFSCAIIYYDSKKATYIKKQSLKISKNDKEK